MLVIIIGLFIAILWGLHPILYKQILTDLSPKTTMLISNLIYTICLLIYSYIYRDEIKKDFKTISKEHMKLFFVGVFICSFAATILYYYILSQNKSSLVVLSTSLSPLFGIIFAKLILNETINTNIYIIAFLLSLSIAFFSYKK